MLVVVCYQTYTAYFRWEEYWGAEVTVKIPDTLDPRAVIDDIVNEGNIDIYGDAEVFDGTAPDLIDISEEKHEHACRCAIDDIYYCSACNRYTTEHPRCKSCNGEVMELDKIGRGNG